MANCTRSSEESAEAVPRSNLPLWTNIKGALTFMAVLDYTPHCNNNRVVESLHPRQRYDLNPNNLNQTLQ